MAFKVEEYFKGKNSSQGDSISEFINAGKSSISGGIECSVWWSAGSLKGKIK